MGQLLTNLPSLFTTAPVDPLLWLNCLGKPLGIVDYQLGKEEQSCMLLEPRFSNDLVGLILNKLSLQDKRNLLLTAKATHQIASGFLQWENPHELFAECIGFWHITTFYFQPPQPFTVAYELKADGTFEGTLYIIDSQSRDPSAYPTQGNWYLEKYVKVVYFFFPITNNQTSIIYSP